jgi:hypothetical protein
MFKRDAVVTSLLLLCATMFSQAATIDSGLFTTYDTDNAKTTLYWTVCGSIGTGTGCYSSGAISPFGHIGSIIEGNKSYNLTNGTVTRILYVVDQEYGSSQNGVALYAYKRVDTITSSFDTTTFTLVKTVVLPLTGGSSAATYMAANSGYLMIGTSLSTVPVEVSKKTYTITSENIISQVPISITADNYGFITVTSANGFFVVGPTGALQEDGGGAPFIIDTLIGIPPI